jgi:hypothetical protein
MAVVLDPREAFPLSDAVSSELNTDSSPGNLADYPHDQNRAMQDAGPTATNLGLTQTWSFGGVDADTASPELASSGTVSAEPNGLVPELRVLDAVGSEASKTGDTVEGPEAAGLLALVGRRGEPKTD